MSIYVVTHKYPDRVPTLDPAYQWLYVGAYRQPDRRDDYCYDDVGDEISQKNGSFCELTGMYWIARNTADPIKGLTHYRRFFTHRECSEQEKHFYRGEEFARLLETYDCVIPKRLYFQRKNIRAYYKAVHHAKDIDILEQVIEELTPEYSPAFQKAMNMNYLFPYNMLVAKQEVFDGYANWLWQILSEVETRIDTADYDAYQKRVIGFLSERLLHVYLLHHGLRFKEVPVVTFGARAIYRTRIRLERVFRRSLYFTFKKKKKK